MLAQIDPVDSGPRKPPGTERLCVATRTVRPVTEMIRFVVGPEGQLVPDLKRKLPGRGVWVTATREALGQAIRRKAFARALKREVRVEPDFPDRVEGLLEHAALDALAIAHKSGAVATGFAKVEAALAGHDVIAVIHAADASPDGVKKITAAARRGKADNIPSIVLFRSAQLDLALGRANVIHAALLPGPASDGFLARCRGLERFRTAVPEGENGTS